MLTLACPLSAAELVCFVVLCCCVRSLASIGVVGASCPPPHRHTILTHLYGSHSYLPIAIVALSTTCHKALNGTA